MNKTIPYRKVLYAGCGLKTDNVKYKVLTDNCSEHDKREKSYRTDLAVDTLILFTEVGYRFSMVMTVLMMLVSIFMIVYSIVVYAASNPVAGWTTTILPGGIGWKSRLDFWKPICSTTGWDPTRS